MSIVEHALEKSRAADQLKPSRRAGDVESERARNRVQQAASIDPAARIQAPVVTVNRESCRQRRLLMRGTGEDADGSAIAAFRMLRTRLLHRARARHWTSIAVTSAGPSDGKTLTVLNLALSMAREKSREIVVLDMDMRNPTVCRSFGVNPPHELRTYLETGEFAQQMFFSVESPNLLIAGSIRPTEHASELLASPRFEEILHIVQRGTVNPIILIDLPPMLLTDDALVVAPKVDATLMVASEGHTGRAELQRALGLLADFTVAGVVLNRAIETAPAYDYSYGYQSEEGHGESDKRA
jgi:Mrp family chromosome partitioning ATPase